MSKTSVQLHYFVSAPNEVYIEARRDAECEMCGNKGTVAEFTAAHYKGNWPVFYICPDCLQSIAQNVRSVDWSSVDEEAGDD